MNNSMEPATNSQIMEYMKDLDQRLNVIESRLGISNIPDSELSKEEFKNLEESFFENQFGEKWFANAGVFIFSIGLAFLLTLQYGNINSAIPSAIGFLIGGIIFFFSKNKMESNPQLSQQLWFAGATLTFFAALRLFNFSTNPISDSITIKSLVILGTVGLLIFHSKYLKSALLTTFALTLLNVGLINIGSINLFLIVNSLSALLFLYFYFYTKKTPLLVYGMVSTYIFHFLWALSIPLSENKFTILNDPLFMPLIAIAYAIIFAMPHLKSIPENLKKESWTPITIVNALLGWGLFQLNNIVQIGNENFIVQFAGGGLFLLLSVTIFFYQKDDLIASVYVFPAMASFSLGIIVSTGVPNLYIELIWLSVLVVGLAILYKSKSIIVLNFLIFSIIFITFFASVGQFNLISISFGIVALITARLLNWQKARLTLQTEMIRNTYLGIAFISIPFTLYKSIPDNYIALSWLGIAIAYYVFSQWLHNVKYRWMAHLTLISSIAYVLVVGLATMESTHIIITLIAQGISLVTVSVFLSKNLNQNLKENINSQQHKIENGINK